MSKVATPAEASAWDEGAFACHTHYDPRTTTDHNPYEEGSFLAAFWQEGWDDYLLYHQSQGMSGNETNPYLP